MATNILEDHSAFIFKGLAVQEDSLNLEDEGAIILRNVGNHPPNDTCHIPEHVIPQEQGCGGLLGVLTSMLTGYCANAGLVTVNTATGFQPKMFMPG